MFSVSLVNSITPMMGEFVFFHDAIMYVLVCMVLLVGGLMVGISVKSHVSLVFLEYSVLEIVWTVIPGVVLFFLALPSLKLLYYMDLSLSVSPNSSVKVVGHQWYWSYGVGGKLGSLSFDSYMLGGNMLEKGDLRLLEVDMPLVVCGGDFVRLLVGSGDVMHSFTVKGLGLKIDAVPGRLNMGLFCSNLYGSFFGQCSEVCGVNHSFMPINVEVVGCFSYILMEYLIYN